MSPRLLNACAACARQYEVGHLLPGDRVRCECGELLLVAHPSPRTVQALRCSRCGGAVEPGAAACAYCSAEIARGEAQLDAICPGCSARMPGQGRYCPACGLAIAPQAILALDERWRCPRCRGRLQGRRLDQRQFAECCACGGLWVEPEDFEGLCAHADRERSDAALAPARPVSQAGARAGARPSPLDQPVAYLPCVRCGERMNRRNYGGSSGVVIDLCRDHGVWLDAAELERVLSFARSGGLERERERAAARRRAEVEAPLPPLPFLLEDRAARPSGLADVLTLIGSFLAR